MSIHGGEGGPSSLASAPSYAGPWSQVKPKLDETIHDHVVHTLGFAQMTPVQSSVIPLFLSHRDVIVEAVTGSGKTLAYALPVLQMVMRRNRDHGSRLRKSQVGALVICPTRELAIQVHGVFDSFIKSHQRDEEDGSEDEKDEKENFPVSNALLAVGGSASSPAEDYKRFREQGSDIIVGTPGRIEELLKHLGVDVKELEVLILDEADRLLDLGFSLILQSILQRLPKQRRTGLFSATMSDALGELARIGLRNPVRVVVKVESKRSAGMLQTSEDRRTPASLQNHFLVCQAEGKMMQLIRLLRKEALNPASGNSAARKAIVYFSTCAQVNYFYKILSKLEEMKGFGLYSLHGQQTPSRRTATFDSFVSATPIGSVSTASDEEIASVLLCTDVAARGLDLPNVDLVVQFDPPTDPKVFSHRCGRTARAGRPGQAVVLLLEGREEDYVNFLKIRKSPVQAYPYLAKRGSGGEDETDLEAQKLTDQMRAIIRQDRDLFELGVKAFVSFIKCYKKHEANFIFREKDLDFGGVATSFALLRLPRMPEIDRWRKERHHAGEGEAGAGTDKFHEEDLDMDKYAYADKSREKQRLEALERKKDERKAELAARKNDAAPAKKRKMRGTQASESAWSVQKAKKERKEERKEKKQAKRAFEKKQRQEEGEQQQKKQEQEGEGKQQQQGMEQSGGDGDADDWAQEEREAKKARKTKANSTAMTSEASFQDL